MVKIVAGVLVACFAGMALPAGAQDTANYKTGPWHYRSIPCADTTVSTVMPRLMSAGQTTFTRRDLEQSGVVVTFNSRLGADPAAPSSRAVVMHYQDTAGNAVMMAERPGDRVQVCFLQSPPPTTFCDPDRDGRGRVYRIWDYRQRAQYAGMNSEHDCGGA